MHLGGPAPSLLPSVVTLTNHHDHPAVSEALEPAAAEASGALDHAVDARALAPETAAARGQKESAVRSLQGQLEGCGGRSGHVGGCCSGPDAGDQDQPEVFNWAKIWLL